MRLLTKLLRLTKACTQRLLARNVSSTCSCRCILFISLLESSGIVKFTLTYVIRRSRTAKASFLHYITSKECWMVHVPYALSYEADMNSFKVWYISSSEAFYFPHYARRGVICKEFGCSVTPYGDRCFGKYVFLDNRLICPGLPAVRICLWDLGRNIAVKIQKVEGTLILLEADLDAGRR